MGSQLHSAKTKFSDLLTEIQPVVAQFIVWLDEKVAEYKVFGHMNLDSGPEAPKWIKDYSMSLLVSGVGGSSQAFPQPAGQRSPRPHSQKRKKYRLRGFSYDGGPPHKKIRETMPSRRDKQPTLDDDDFEIIEIKEERANGDEYLKSWSEDVSSADNKPSFTALAVINASFSPSSQNVHPLSSTIQTISSPLPHRTTSLSSLTADHNPDENSGFDMSVESFDENNINSQVESEDIKPFIYQNPSHADSNTCDDTFPGAEDSPSMGYYGMAEFDTSGQSTSGAETAEQQTQGPMTSPQRIRSTGGYTFYVCKFCGKRFLARGGLLMHERIHTGERPFKCSYCAKTFVQNGDRQRHESLHTGLKTYKCRYCDKSYVRKDFREKHERQQHVDRGSV